MFEQKAALLAVYAVLLLATCILPFALQLRTYKSPSAWTIDRVYGVAAGPLRTCAACGAPVARAHKSGGPFHCVRSAARSFGRGICHRRTPCRCL